MRKGIRFLLSLAFFITSPACTRFTTSFQTSLPSTGAALGVNFGTACVNYAGHWGYPAERASITADLQYYKSKGMKIYRMPIQWEDLQTSLYGSLTPWMLDCLHYTTTSARQLGLKVILDVHNYGRYIINNSGVDSLLGSTDLPISALVDVWQKLATEFNGDQGLYGYDLMNEPHDMLNATIWPTAVQQTINAIRAIDTTTPIIVEGDNWASAAAWNSNTAFATLTDTANKLIFESHVYFDDTSGQYTQNYDYYVANYGIDPNIGVTRVQPFVAWLEAHNAKGLVGEYGAPGDDARWITVVDKFLQYLTQHGVDSTYWTGGYIYAMFGQESFTPPPWYLLEPFGGSRDGNGVWQLPANPVDRPMMSTLRKYATP